MNTTDESQTQDQPAQDQPAPEQPTADGPPAGGPPRRLVRYPDDGPGAGVAAGLGAHFGVDPVIFRIAFILLTLAGGSGILAYIIGWVAMPEATPADRRAPVTPESAGAPQLWIGIGLIVLAALVLNDQGGLSTGLVWATALVGVGVLLLLQERGSATDRGAGDGPGPQRSPDAAPATRAYEQAGGEGSPGAPTPAPPPAAPERPPSPLGRLTIGTGLLVLGGAALLDNVGAVRMAASDYVALGLVVVGIGLLVGSVIGRARHLILIGVLLLPALVVATVAPGGVPWQGGAGDRSYAPVEVADLQDRYALGAGELTVDLSALELPDEPVAVTAVVTAGEVVVIVPSDVTVRVEARVAAGEIDLFGSSHNGLRVERRERFQGAAAAGELHLDLRANVGTIQVIRR